MGCYKFEASLDYIDQARWDTQQNPAHYSRENLYEAGRGEGRIWEELGELRVHVYMTKTQCIYMYSTLKAITIILS